MALLQEYQEASDKLPTLNVLKDIINAPPTAINEAERPQLVQALLEDVRSSPRGRITSNDLPQALLAVKTLGRVPAGSRIIVQTDNLKLLLKVATDANETASSEALRCVANAMLLVESGRVEWVEIKGGDAAIDLLERSTTPDRLFLACRILFLASAASSPFIKRMIEELRFVDIATSKYDFLTNSLSKPMAREALVDLLKATFNTLVHYPRLIGGGTVIGDSWSDKLDGFLPPIIRLFNTIPYNSTPPLPPPLPHIIHALVTFPVSPNLLPRWCLQPASPPRSSFSSNRSSPEPLPDASSSSRSGSPATLGRAFTGFLNSTKRSLSRSPAPPSYDTLNRAFQMLDHALAYYLPGSVDVDDVSIRQRVIADNGPASLDEALGPLFVLVTNMSSGDTPSRARVREWVLPVDLDRSAGNPLEGRADMLGRCLRLMSSARHQRLKDAASELLFVLCDSDASLFSDQIGYGNAAGFLFNRGLLSAAPGTSGAAAPTGEINPITGIANDDGPSELSEMTEEEKEREAEKLFVLFDRLERRGLAVNPVRHAIQSGKMEEYARRAEEREQDSD